MVEEFPISLAPSDRTIPLKVFDQNFLVKYPFRERWLSKAEAVLPSDSRKVTLMDLCFEGRVDNRVQLYWVPGHCGIIGNEEAGDQTRF
jgi:ribonuclease HI